MNRFLISLALLASPLLANAGPNVGVSVNIGQPGFYGQIELGNVPPPPVMYGTPMIIQPAPVGVVVQPLYLRVPSSHYRNWRHYCGRYNACGRPVYFVQDNWYRNTYAPQYRHEHEGRGYEHRDYDHHDHDRHDDRHEDRHDDRR
ncbi:hypothetical protein [Solimicrobium silvestre]|uniref:Uncharacterized protein n=1 Tax=Solimicrobium silvestre TaxID=2099400 RepID=A0A2S9GXH0_9BURK|nr:hypothetical protein [Solimicrobium silvestre]PRC92415.1 hypothetical protein S2091_2790 [Solimicrobium silvestre]